jgi:hypothetical protein
VAVKIVTKTYTFGATGQALLAAIMDMPEKTWIGSLSVRSHRDNADDVFWADEGGQQGGYIGPAEAVTMDFGEGQTLIRQFALYGASGDIIYLTVGLNTVNYDSLSTT